ncbi:MAG TPA: hypothetical protein VLW55_21545 [Burkholderiaceae bacterium]|nr:hypothetical protein [Burkholderiaceae bacterium]
MSRQHGTQKVTKIFLPPSRLEWTDEKLAALDSAQLKTLLENLALQHAAGRVSDEVAGDLTMRITSRLPVNALTPKRKRSRALIMLDTRIAESLGDLARLLSARYDLSEETARERSTDTAGFRPQQLTNKQGQGKAGASMKKGTMAIDRFIAYRVRDSLASLAYLLAMDQPQQTGRYVLLATDDLLGSGVPIAEVMPPSGDYGWSRESRERLRAKPTVDFAEAQRLYEELIARVATKRTEK